MKATICGLVIVSLLPNPLKAQKQALPLGPMRPQIYSVSLNGIVDIKPFLELGYERLLTNRISVAVYPGIYLPYNFTWDDGRTIDAGDPATYFVYGGRLRSDLKVYLRMPEKVRERTNYVAAGIMLQARHEDLAGWVNRYGATFREYRDFGMNQSHFGVQIRVGEQWVAAPAARTSFLIDYWCGMGVRYGYVQFRDLPSDVLLSEIDTRNAFVGSLEQGGSFSPMFSAGLKIGLGRK